MIFTNAIRVWLNKPILDQLQKMEAKQMSQVDDLTAKIDGIVTLVGKLGTDLTAEIARIKAQFPDISSQLTKLDGIATSLTSIDTETTGA